MVPGVSETTAATLVLLSHFTVEIPSQLAAPSHQAAGQQTSLVLQIS